MQNNIPLIAIMGNPNSGKTAIFNLLTGLNLKVSNYPGITVEKRKGMAQLLPDCQVEILDMPGTYSLTPESLDEKIVAQQALDWMHGEGKPIAIISVVDAGNLSRNLYLTSQIIDLDIPVIVALNMMDRVKKKNQDIDSKSLKEMLGVTAVLPMSAHKKWGIDELKSELAQLIQNEYEPVISQMQLRISDEIVKCLDPLNKILVQNYGYDDNTAMVQSLKIISRDSALELYRCYHEENQIEMNVLIEIRNSSIQKIEKLKVNYRILEASARYEMLDNALVEHNIIIKDELHKESRSEKVDKILTHKYCGPLIFIFLLYCIFQSIFTWAAVPMNWINIGVGHVGNYCSQVLPPGILKDLLVEGVISGVGSILIFLPQILFLMFFLTILEDTGYMARVAFMMDKVMNKIGLHGKSVLPLMSGYACAIPGIMASRTIDNWKERLVTIMVLPLMSCSARLPIYTLMIGAFIPDITILGVLNLQGMTMVMMYFLGTFTAMLIAAFISYFITESGSSSFVMEMPPYRMPLSVSIFRDIINRGKLFIVNAGKIIMAISIVLWLLASFPKSDFHGKTTPIKNSYAGQIGQLIEPFIAPLGFDWKIGVGLITSFAAREVMVSTLATLYNVEEEGDDVVGIVLALKNDINPNTGNPRYTPLVALSLMVFYVYAAQCMATFAIVRNETNTWKWPIIMIIYMTTLAYLGSFIVYQGGQILGFV